MLEVKFLSKNFGELKAVDNVSLSLAKGDILGFLGPNGAGKSTTMKMICGFLTPDQGESIVAGHSVSLRPRQARLHFGYVPENAPLYQELLVYDFLHFTAEMRNLGKQDIEQKIMEVSEMVAIKEVMYKKIETLSKGFKRRVSLAQALIHDPDILILDEPTDGLDPNQKFEVRELIKKLSQTKAILISTHILEEVEEVCNRCIIIGNGKILFEGSPEQLKAKSNKGRIQDVFRAITGQCSVEGVQL